MRAPGLFSITRAVFFAFGGVVVAGLLAVQHLAPSADRLCRQASGCGAVLASRYARVGPVPVAFVGVVFYAALLCAALACLGWPAGRVRRVLARGAAGVAIAGVLASAAFMVIQVGVVRAFCPLCTLSALLSALLAHALFEAARAADWPAQPLGALALSAFLMLVLALGAMPVRDSLEAPARAGAGAGGLPDVLASVNGRPITAADLARERPPGHERLARELYDLRRHWLDLKIDQVLVGQEAAARGTTAEDLLEKLLAEKAAPEIEKARRWVEERRAKDPGAGGDDPLYWARLAQSAEEDVRRRVLGDFVAGLRARARVEDFLPRPPGALVFDPALAHVKGRPDADLRLVVFSDFECPYCAELAGVLDRLMADPVQSFDVSVSFVHMPMAFHELARPAAVAAEAAAAQGRFWAYHDRLMKLNGRVEPKWEEYARDVGLDLERFKAALADPAVADRVERSRRAGQAAGLDADGPEAGVPALFLNGRRIGGALTYEQLTALLGGERGRAR